MKVKLSFLLIYKYCTESNFWYQVDKFHVEILEKVQSRNFPYFRPDISGYDCPENLAELMRKCWSDNAEERPTFDNIRDTIRRTMK